MKTMATLLIVMIITSTIQSIKMSEYKRTNETLKSMVDEVAEYADSTMDTGEFDEFCQYKVGHKFVKKYDELYWEKSIFPYNFLKIIYFFIKNYKVFINLNILFYQFKYTLAPQKTYNKLIEKLYNKFIKNYRVINH